MTAVLEVRHATKSFPGVKALDDVSLEIRKNEVVGLIGENGAGKSTLLKVLNGVYTVDEGEIRVNGRATPIAGPRDAFDHGIAMVFQEQSILTTLSVAENIFLGRENEFLRWGVLDKTAMHAAAAVELRKVHLDVDPAASCGDLTFAERQMVEIAKAISLDTRVEGDIVILLDEPTSVLESKEIEVLFRLVRELRGRAAFVFNSHRIDEVLDVSDRVYVMRDGRWWRRRPRRRSPSTACTSSWWDAPSTTNTTGRRDRRAGVADRHGGSRPLVPHRFSQCLVHASQGRDPRHRGCHRVRPRGARAVPRGPGANRLRHAGGRRRGPPLRPPVRGGRGGGGLSPPGAQDRGRGHRRAGHREHDHVRPRRIHRRRSHPAGTGTERRARVDRPAEHQDPSPDTFAGSLSGGNQQRSCCRSGASPTPASSSSTTRPGGSTSARRRTSTSSSAT